MVRCSAGHDGAHALDDGNPSCRLHGSARPNHWIAVRVVKDGTSVESSPDSEQFESGDMPPTGEVVAVVMEILLNAGPDAVQLSTVAHELGRNLGELEETFGHPGELLHSAWESCLRIEFENLVGQAKRFMSGDIDSIDLEVSTSPLRKAASHLLIVSDRYDELCEAVPFDVQRILFEQEPGHDDDVDRSVFRALIGWLLGIALEPGRRNGDTLRLLRHIGWEGGIWREAHLTDRAERTPPLPLVFDEAGDMSQEVLGACTRIVAQGGFSRATLLRIARMAGYPPEVLYGMYGRQEYLIGQYMRSVFALLFSFTRFAEYMDSPAYAAMRLDVWLEPDMSIRRRALLESVMASNFSPLMESAFLGAAEAALTDMRLAHLDISEARTEIARMRFLASRQIALGLALLDDVEVERSSRDWSPFVHVLFANND